MIKQLNKQIIVTAAVFGLLAVVFGAFGAHKLKELISVSAVAIWQKGVEYQFYHTFALLFLATIGKTESKFTKLAFYSFSVGIVLFSGSLYVLAASALCFKDIAKFIGPITPVGGLFFILGWLFLILASKNTANGSA